MKIFREALTSRRTLDTQVRCARGYIGRNQEIPFYAFGVLRIMAGTSNQEQLRKSLLSRLADARARTDEAFRLLRPDCLYERPIPERHRNIFYLGHFEAFDWNLIWRGAMGRDPFHASFDRLFAFGIDPTAGDLPSDQPSDWPSLSEVEAYNRRVRGAMDQILREESFSNPNHPWIENGLVFHVAIEHRFMHAETFAYMLHRMSPEKKIKPKIRPQPSPPLHTPRIVEIPAGTATLGLVKNGDSAFGWDNEFECRQVTVPRFAIDAFNVTNGRYLEFIRSGGYNDPAYWTQADWEWKTSAGITHPGFWRQRADEWYYRTMFDEVPLPLEWPVYVSYAEASAYARWRGKTLPTEEQFHRAAYGKPAGPERLYPWGDEKPKAGQANVDFHSWDPMAVAAHPAGESAFGVADLVGNGWEWTCTPFGPFAGFQIFPFYPGYSANFFDGKHYVLKGGSPQTAACLLRRSYRNWFQPHYPYIYATFRCVENG